MKPKVPLLAALAFTAIAISALFGATDSAHGGTFNPVLTYTLEDSAAGANSDFTLDFQIPEGDAQFAAAVFFIPPEWGVTPGGDIPIGAVVASLRAQATLGLINAPCNSVLPVEFTMLNASIDPSDTVIYLDDDENGDPDYWEDKDQSGLKDGVEKYPDFITRALVDEDGNPLTPLRRSAGTTTVGGVKVLLQFLIFEPGTFIDEDVPNGADLGYPSVTLLQNVGDPDTDPIPSAITDFCTPLGTTINNFGVSKDNGCTDSGEIDPICDVSAILLEETGTTDPDESGIPLLTNPAEGSYTFTFIGAGQRDADGDGYENSLDTCPFTPNEGDPRVKGDGDLDEDGLDAACDPDDSVTNSDEDLDGYTNRQDNCSIDANGDLPPEDNQRDSDDDSTGDACDPNPDDAAAQGELVFATLTHDVEIGPDGAPSDQTPSPGETPPADGGDGDDGGGSSLIFIIIAVAAGVVVLGGGAFYFMRRGGA